MIRRGLALLGVVEASSSMSAVSCRGSLKLQICRGPFVYEPTIAFIVSPLRKCHQPLEPETEARYPLTLNSQLQPPKPLTAPKP